MVHFHRVAGFQAKLFYLLRRHINIIGRGQVVVERASAGSRSHHRASVPSVPSPLLTISKSLRGRWGWPRWLLTISGREAARCWSRAAKRSSRRCWSRPSRGSDSHAAPGSLLVRGARATPGLTVFRGSRSSRGSRLSRGASLKGAAPGSGYGRAVRGGSRRSRGSRGASLRYSRSRGPSVRGSRCGHRFAGLTAIAVIPFAGGSR